MHWGCRCALSGAWRKKYFGEGVGIAMRKADTELLARVNKAIAEIRQNGEFKKIQDKYFDFEIFAN